MKIGDKVRDILKELPPGCGLVAAAKSRSPEEVLEAAEAGVRIIGENYLQDAEAHFQVVGCRVSWHFIGHLQKNKVKKAVTLFDLIETVDSLELAAEINRRSRAINKTMEIFMEVNSGREPQKFGVMPEEVELLFSKISELSNVRVMGLMTMGPACSHPDDLRPYFKEIRLLWEGLKSSASLKAEMRYLSMGMSDSYRVAIEEGANLVRIGTGIFGPRITRT
ncbi:MAG: YggS family pyridoxal phosphate-dependent enzyme [Candidatus Omnitrophica bacterium]|nr:YggS family pyridoxal phosphate-dependent enzyme [Candidatus Omnitrophota bacterium]